MGNENDTENNMYFFKCKWTFKTLYLRLVTFIL